MHIWLPRRPELLPTLDERLTAAAALVREGEPVADIGCDHGKLTAVLAASGKYPKVIGADLRPGPLAKAKQTLEHARCEDRAELRLGDGLSVLSAGEVGTIVLAGVSAQTTWEIIEKAPWVSQPGGRAWSWCQPPATASCAVGCGSMALPWWPTAPCRRQAAGMP